MSLILEIVHSLLLLVDPAPCIQQQPSDTEIQRWIDGLSDRRRDSASLGKHLRHSFPLIVKNLRHSNTYVRQRLAMLLADVPPELRDRSVLELAAAAKEEKDQGTLQRFLETLHTLVHDTPAPSAGTQRSASVLPLACALARRSAGSPVLFSAVDRGSRGAARFDGEGDIPRSPLAKRRILGTSPGVEPGGDVVSLGLLVPAFI